MKINKIILGTAQIGLDLGIKSLDSSEKYGDAHQIIGEFHTLFPEHIFNVITKIPPKEHLDNIDLKIKKYL